MNNLYEDINHELRDPYDRSKGKIDTILHYIELINSKLGTELSFNNIVPNHYTIKSRNKEFVFSTYSDVTHALELILQLNLILY